MNMSSGANVDNVELGRAQEAISIVVSADNGSHERRFRVRKTAPLRKVFDAYANCLGIPLEYLSFFHDGESLSPDQTLEMLQFKDSDQIQCALECGSWEGWTVPADNENQEAGQTTVIQKRLNYLVHALRKQQDGIRQCKDSIARYHNEIFRAEEMMCLRERSLKALMLEIRDVNRQKQQAHEQEFQETERIVAMAAAALSPTPVTPPVTKTPRTVAQISSAEDGTEGSNDDQQNLRCRKRRR